MPEHLRSLFYIILLALITFYFAKKLTANIVSEPQFNRWRNTWIALTCIVFLAGNFWIYIILSAMLLFYVGKQEQNPFALFFVLLFAVPRISDNIPGFGIVNFLFAVDYVSILSFTVLLPAYLSLRKQHSSTPFLKYMADKLLLAYMVLDVVLLMRDTTVTDALRAGVANFTDIFLPYYVASRGIKDLQQFKEVIVAFVISAMVVAMLAMFEYSRFWLLYVNLKNHLGVVWVMGGYLGRGDSLRALATLGQPIILGYVMVMALGFYLFLAKKIQNRYFRMLGWGLILGGLYVPLSRGPWVGAAILVTLYILISPKALKRLTMLAIATAMIVPLMASMPAGKKVIDMLPFIGKTDTENVDYRIRLLDSAYIVFNRYPLFGTVNFNDDLAEFGMTQGEGIVDVVNTYLYEVLEHGLVGLILFVAFLSIAVISVALSIRKVEDKTSDTHLIGRILLVNLVATLVTITTVSSILVLPIIYWTIAGIGIAYSRLLEGYVSSKLNVELQSYRLAFDVLPALSTARLAFSALTTHRVVLDTKPVQRIAIKAKNPTLNLTYASTKSKSANAESPSSNMKLPTRLKAIIPSNQKPHTTDLYHIARTIRPHSESNFAHTIPTTLAATPEMLVKVAKIQILNGSNAGRELLLNKILNKLGKTGVQVALITRRQNGYYITHLEGKVFPIVNDLFTSERAYALNDQDLIELNGIKMRFFANATLV